MMPAGRLANILGPAFDRPGDAYVVYITVMNENGEPFAGIVGV